MFHLIHKLAKKVPFLVRKGVAHLISRSPSLGGREDIFEAVHLHTRKHTLTRTRTHTWVHMQKCTHACMHVHTRAHRTHMHTCETQASG